MADDRDTLIGDTRDSWLYMNAVQESLPQFREYENKTGGLPGIFMKFTLESPVYSRVISLLLGH